MKCDEHPWKFDGWWSSHLPCGQVGPPNGCAHMILRPCGQRSRKIRIISEAVWMVTVWHFSSGTGRESLCAGNKLNHLSLDIRATPLRISRKLVSSKQWRTVLRAERNLRFCVFCLPSLHWLPMRSFQAEMRYLQEQGLDVSTLAAHFGPLGHDFCLFWTSQLQHGYWDCDQCLQIDGWRCNKTITSSALHLMDLISIPITAWCRQLGF